MRVPRDFDHTVRLIVESREKQNGHAIHRATSGKLPHALLPRHGDDGRWPQGLGDLGRIGNIVAQAEGEACTGHFSDGCTLIGDWIPNHQGHRAKVIAQKDVLALRQTVLLVDDVNPGRTWRDAGLWLGHSGGAASVAKYANKNTWDVTIREGLRRAISRFNELAEHKELKAKATDLATRVETVARLADPTPPDYAAVISQIESLVMSV